MAKVIKEAAAAGVAGVCVTTDAIAADGAAAGIGVTVAQLPG